MPTTAEQNETTKHDEARNKHFYRLIHHTGYATRIREALQAISAEKRKKRAPASSSGLRPPFWGLLFDTPTRDAVTGPSSRSPIGLLLRRDRPKDEDLLEVEPLVSRVRGMVLRVVFCALFTVRPES